MILSISLAAREVRSDLSETVLDAVFVAGVMPFDRTIDAGDHAGPAFKAAGELHYHLSLLIQGIEVGRAGIDAEPLLTGATDFLVEKDMGLLIVFKGI